MISDRELFIQMLERDVVNIYEGLANNNSLLKLPAVQERAFSYADIGINYLTELLFGSSSSNCTVDEASNMAKMVADDKINAYRERLKKQKQEMDN